MLEIEHLGLKPYEGIWEAMKAYTLNRDELTPDKLWLLEHPPVYTQGQAGKEEHLINPSPEIPVIQSDRGGQVTYHGPGQLVAYLLMDIRRKNIGIRTLVRELEQLLIAVLRDYKIQGETQCKAPGVYVQGKKIASIGLRVKNGCTYHGIALNVNMDLSPFSNINPCGYKQLAMTQISDFEKNITVAEVSQNFAALVAQRWGD